MFYVRVEMSSKLNLALLRLTHLNVLSVHHCEKNIVVWRPRIRNTEEEKMEEEKERKKGSLGTLQWTEFVRMWKNGGRTRRRSTEEEREQRGGRGRGGGGRGPCGIRRCFLILLVPPLLGRSSFKTKIRATKAAGGRLWDLIIYGRKTSRLKDKWLIK